MAWKTSTGRANFLVYPGLAENPDPSVSGMLRMATIRSHDQYNTTLYSLNDRYRGVFGGRKVVFMNQDDMAERNITADTLVEIESIADTDRERLVRSFKVRPYDIPKGSVATYYPETNELLPLSHHDARSKTPSAKSIPVLIRPMA